MSNQPHQFKNRKVAALLAIIGVLPIPIAGLNKFYLGQKWWGILYLSLCWTPIPKVASLLEAVWYLIQDPEEFDQNFNGGMAATEPIAVINRPRSAAVPPVNVASVADAMRELDQLRQDGLISEYEFEQKRRKLLDRMV
jgi:TM2 domain-containing membrane protein YozV